MIYAFGDIHGMFNLFKQGLDWVEQIARPEDILVFLGDYIDRGPDSKSVLETMCNLQTRRPNSIFVSGNHEAMFLSVLNYLLKEDECVDPTMWLNNGGITTLYSYGITRWDEVTSKIPKTHYDFICNLSIQHTIDKFTFVHAGLGFGNCSSDDRYDPRLWMQRGFINCDEDFGSVIIFGHAVQQDMRPLVRWNKIGLDTGSCFYNCLSIGVFDSLDTTSFGLIQVTPEVMGNSCSIQRIPIPRKRNE